MQRGYAWPYFQPHYVFEKDGAASLGHISIFTAYIWIFGFCIWSHKLHYIQPDQTLCLYCQSLNLAFNDKNLASVWCFCFKAFLKSWSCRPYLGDGVGLRDESPQAYTLMRKTNIGAGFRGIQPGCDCLLISLDILLLRLFCRRKKTKKQKHLHPDILPWQFCEYLFLVFSGFEKIKKNVWDFCTSCTIVTAIKKYNSNILSHLT